MPKPIEIKPIHIQRKVKNMSYQLELTYDQTTDAAIYLLHDILEQLLADYDNRKSGGNLSVFETDRAKDLKLIKRQIKATRRVLDWIEP
jgi:hypothetical protein